MRITGYGRNAKVQLLRPGVEGVKQTLAEMKRLATRDINHPVVREVVSKIRGGTDMDEIRAAFNWVVRNMSYKHDPEDAELVICPHRMITEFRKGDCDDLSTVLACILKSAGYQTQFKVIAWRVKDYTHVYLEVFVPSLKGWMPLDPVMKLQGFGNEKAPIIKSARFPV